MNLTNTLGEFTNALAEFKTVTSKATLFEALPLIMLAKEKHTAMKQALENMKKALDLAEEKAAAYAIAHPSIFDVTPWQKSPKGVWYGDIRSTIENIVYHLFQGYGSPIRQDGGKLTQEFIGDLPDDLTSAKLKIDLTQFKQKGHDETELAGLGLVREANNVWSIKEDDDALANADE